jgi:hypothetical protein
MKKVIVRKVLDSIGVFVAYCAISLAIGEWHPFSKFPMYSSFPNWSYAFYLSDEAEEMIPWWSAFQVDAVHMAHRFYGICQHNGIAYGHGMESAVELRFIGNEMLKSVQDGYQLPYEKELNLYRRHFFVEGDSIIHVDIQMATIHAEPVE